MAAIDNPSVPLANGPLSPAPQPDQTNAHLLEFVWGQFYPCFCRPVEWEVQPQGEARSDEGIRKVCDAAGCPRDAVEALKERVEYLSKELRGKTGSLETCKTAYVWLFFLAFLLAFPIAIGVGVKINSGAALGGMMGGGVALLAVAYLCYSCSIRSWEEDVVKQFVASQQSGLQSLSERLGLRLTLEAVNRAEGRTRSTTHESKRMYRWRPVMRAWKLQPSGGEGA